MPDFITLTMLDSGGSKGTMTFHQPADEPDNHLAALASFQTALAVITNGVIGQIQISRIIRSTPTLPTSREVQREKKFILVYKDVTADFTIGAETFENPNFGREFTLEIPTADLSVSNILNDKDEWTYDRSSPAAPWSAFKTAFEAFVKSPSGGDVELMRVWFAGRSR